MSHKQLTYVMMMGLALGSVGCVNGQVFGVYLGPRSGTGLTLKGVVPPSDACLFDGASTVFQLEGAMELGDGQQTVNQYVTVLSVENTLQSNEYTASIQNAPNQTGPYGGSSTNNVDIVGATVRYEYPKQPASIRARYANEPIEGILSGTSTPATGKINAGQTSAIRAQILSQDRATELFRDPTVKRELSGPEGFLMIAYVTLEGVNGHGQRVTSDELSFPIRLVAAGALNNCEAVQEACPAGQTAERNPNLQCFPGQDRPLCTGKCI